MISSRPASSRASFVSDGDDDGDEFTADICVKQESMTRGSRIGPI